MKTVGYALIKKTTTTGKGCKNVKEFEDQYCRVMEFDRDGGAMVLNNAGDALAMFDACDIHSKFTCNVNGQVILPPNLNAIEQLMYTTKALTRKGGYNTILGNMVIVASCAKGQFTDTFLWQKQ